MDSLRIAKKIEARATFHHSLLHICWQLKDIISDPDSFLHHQGLQYDLVRGVYALLTETLGSIKTSIDTLCRDVQAKFRFIVLSELEGISISYARIEDNCNKFINEITSIQQHCSRKLKEIMELYITSSGAGSNYLRQLEEQVVSSRILSEQRRVISTLKTLYEEAEINSSFEKGNNEQAMFYLHGIGAAILSSCSELILSMPEIAHGDREAKIESTLNLFLLGDLLLEDESATRYEDSFITLHKFLHRQSSYFGRLINKILLFLWIVFPYFT